MGGDGLLECSTEGGSLYVSMFMILTVVSYFSFPFFFPLSLPLGAGIDSPGPVTENSPSLQDLRIPSFNLRCIPYEEREVLKRRVKTVEEPHEYLTQEQVAVLLRGTDYPTLESMIGS
jgi:hypothetical protein